MAYRFYLKYKTFYGQSLCLNLLDDKGGISAIPMSYLNEQFWTMALDEKALQSGGEIQYYYSLYENGIAIKTDSWKNRLIDVKAFSSDVEVYDDWQDILIEKKVFESRAFTKVLTPHQAAAFKSSFKKGTHVFTVHTTQLKPGRVLCILGSGKAFNNWSETSPLLMRNVNEVWQVEVDLKKEQMPLEFKYAIYDTHAGRVEKYEASENRKLQLASSNNSNLLLHHFVDFHLEAWKGTGVNIQLSSLKTDASWGVGDFSDLNMLTDWAKRTGVKMIQLLPINDTTATRTRKDSYPYSAVSAFAQHPVFLDLQPLLKKYKVKLPEALLQEARQLNALPALDYEAVVALKQKALVLIFNKAAKVFQKENEYKVFYSEHVAWLLPYAVFSALRDKMGTADYQQWSTGSRYNEQEVKLLAEKGSDVFEAVQLYCFLQYHLHLQLSAAVAYAHQSGIIIKGDLPIGVGRYSVETWMNPGLFHMDQQAGAPPDAFAVKGQNWSFPTYNWEAMKHDGYLWWRQRLQHMSNYFDATRVDHVLGFFRIWSIPLHAIDGIFGYFSPALALSAADFQQRGLYFDESRFCDPFITDELLQKEFSVHADWVRDHILVKGRFKEEFNTQQKLEDFWKKNPFPMEVKNRLFDWLANVILLREENNPGAFHFRIDMQHTTSFKHLPPHEQRILNDLYVDYFYRKQNELWYQVAQQKLNAVQQSSDMLICAEDLGMVPDMVEDVLKSREMLALQVQRMPKKSHEKFSLPSNAPYLSVVTPSTHDMSTIRQWWEEDRAVTQDFFNTVLHQAGKAPAHCEPEVARWMVKQHLQSPAMWCVFLMQDIMAMNADVRKAEPDGERINIPADPNHYWNYRMHFTLEELLKADGFNKEVKAMIEESGRGR